METKVKRVADGDLRKTLEDVLGNLVIIRGTKKSGVGEYKLAGVERGVQFNPFIVDRLE